jgi:hypothetical protein
LGVDADTLRAKQSSAAGLAAVSRETLDSVAGDYGQHPIAVDLHDHFVLAVGNVDVADEIYRHAAHAPERSVDGWKTIAGKDPIRAGYGCDDALGAGDETTASSEEHESDYGTHAGIITRFETEFRAWHATNATSGFRELFLPA